MLRVRSTFVGRPFSHVYPSQSTVLKIWNRVVAIQYSENVSSLSAFQTFSVCSKASSMLVRTCLITSSHQNKWNVPSLRTYTCDRCTSWWRCIWSHHSSSKSIFSVLLRKMCLPPILLGVSTFYCPSSHVDSWEDDGTTHVQMTNNTHLRKLNAVHPERPSVRAPVAFALTRRATLFRSQAFVLAHEGNLTPPLLSTKDKRTKAKDTPAHSTRWIALSTLELQPRRFSCALSHAARADLSRRRRNIVLVVAPCSAVYVSMWLGALVVCLFSCSRGASICFALQFDLPVHRVVAYLSHGDVFNLTCVLQDARPSFREPVNLLGAPGTPVLLIMIKNEHWWPRLSRRLQALLPKEQDFHWLRRCVTRW